MKSFIFISRLASLIFACVFSISTANISTAFAQEIPAAQVSAAPEKPFLRPEVSVSLGVNYYWSRTSFGGATTFGVLFPFNLYVGLELSGFYSDASYITRWDQDAQQTQYIRYKQDHTHIALLGQLGYDIELGSAFTIRPYLMFGRNVRYYGAFDRIVLSSNSWIEPTPAQIYTDLELTPGLLASYHINEKLRLGINLRTNVSALLTLQYRL
jgi:hypothetical protein